MRRSWSVGLGGIGAGAPILSSIFALLIGVLAYFPGETLIVAGIIGLCGVIIETYGSFINKKIGGGLMIAAGSLIFIVSETNKISVIGVLFFGALLLLGGILAFLEKSSKQ